jgi:hypothetical protein
MHTAKRIALDHVALAAVLLLAALSQRASAQANAAAKDAAAAPTAVTPPDPQRLELAGFPIVAGNTDIGVQFGGAVTITRFDGELAPYLWNLDVLLSTSLKSEQVGVRFVQQSHVLRLDLPQLLGGRLRVDTRGSFERTVNDGYYGLGNNAALVDATDAASNPRRYQFLFQETRIRSIGRLHTHTPLDVAFVTALRYVQPNVYANSRLAQDVAPGQASVGPAVVGARQTALLKLGGGVMYDTRDSEFVTHRGLYYQLGVAGSLGTSSENIRYGEVAAVLAHYLQLPSVFMLAVRVVGSCQFGRVPFYDLALGGVFDPQRLFGSESALRGVPFGRYAGAVKALANLELRSAGRRFQFIGQRLRLGTTTFVDFGRVWADYAPDPVRDGRTLGLKYGIGGGVFVQWGDAAIFRIEAAYSPDAAAANPKLPFGIYAADGLMF